MSNLRLFHCRALLVACVLVGCRSTDDSSVESTEEPTATGKAAAEDGEPSGGPRSSATASGAKPNSGPRPHNLDLPSSDLDPVYTLENLPSGATPGWPAPKARQDRAPITLRAAITGGDVVVWGYGDGATSSLAFDIRFLDEAGVVRQSDHQGQPISAEQGKWFRVARAGKTEWPRAQVQITEATVDAGGGSKKWTPAQPFHRTKWRHGLPESAAKEVGDSGVGFAVVGRERHEARPRGFSSEAVKPGTIEGVLVVAIRNGGKTPLERVELELSARDVSGTSEPSVGVWTPMLGDAPEPVIAPGAWSFVEVVVKGDLERALAATDFTMKVTAVEKAK